MQELIEQLEKEHDAAAAALEPFDAGIWLGHPHDGFIAYPTAAEVRTALATGPIRRAVVSHTAGWLLDTTIGNDDMAGALKDLPGCVGTMSLVPEGAECFDALEPYVDHYLKLGLRMARVFPKSQRFTLRVPAAAAMLRLLEAKGIPLMIQIGQTSIDELAGLAQKFPKLAIIIDSTGHHEFLNIRGVLGQLESTPNLFVTTKGQYLCGGLELLAKRLGAERILLSTNQPMDQAGACLSLLIHSDLGEADQRLIAHGNLERLLAGVEHGGIYA